MGGFRKNDEKKIDEVFHELLRAYGISRKYDEHRLKSEWENIVGKTIAHQTLSLVIDKEIMYVRLKSPALRQELSYSKGKLVDKLNGIVGKDLIRDIIFL
ncbi:MAG: DUF721 domain-containing protein [Bacteroidales bacterium]|nr:DUF721 domain-containing protein [Bacteroidales bacterium]RLD38491.1 MAG: DUF721 domain-containing protein [Bacteroidota bacterium]